MDKIGYLPKYLTMEKQNAPTNYDVVILSLQKLKLSEVLFKQSFDLTDEILVYYLAKKKPPVHNEVVEAEFESMLHAVIITSALSAGLLQKIIATIQDGI